MKNRWESQVKVSLDDIFGIEEETKEEEEEETEEQEDIEEEFDLCGFSKEDQIELAVVGAQIKDAVKYQKETGKNPIKENGKLSKDFASWITEHKKFYTPSELKAKRLENAKKREKEQVDDIFTNEQNPKDNIFAIDEEDAEEVFETHEKDVLQQALSWLYKFMGNMDFIDYKPIEADIEMLEKIEKMIK